MHWFASDNIPTAIINRTRFRKRFALYQQSAELVFEKQNKHHCSLPLLKFFLTRLCAFLLNSAQKGSVCGGFNSSRMSFHFWTIMHIKLLELLVSLEKRVMSQKSKFLSLHAKIAENRTRTLWSWGIQLISFDIRVGLREVQQPDML